MINTTTWCRDCVLAEYDGDTQQGCRLGRLEKFDEAGAEVRGVDDGSRRFFAISRYCNAFRTWDEPTGLDPAVIIRRQVECRYAAIIYCNSGTTRADLAATLESLGGQSPGPRKVVVVFDEGAATFPGVTASLRDAALDCKWESIEVKPKGDEEEAIYGPDDRGRAIDIAVASLDPRSITYYSAATAGTRWHDGYFAHLDRQINDLMMPIASARGLGIETTMLILHNHEELQGNRLAPLAEKLPEAAAKHGFRLLFHQEGPPCE